MKFYKFLISLIIILTLSIHPVLADDEEHELSHDFSSITVSSNNTSVPPINSKSAIIYDRSSGSILYGKSENEKRKMASTTKIMTAIIVIENSNLDDIVTISQKAAGTGGSRLGLHVNDKISIRDLLYGLLLCSGNDSAVALAETIGGSVEEFANLMNQKAISLGLNSTHFVTPHGLDNDDHYTTAYELALITDYALKNDIFCNLVGSKTHTILINNQPKTISNTNELLGNLNGVYGVKTGFTNGANRCLVTSIKRDNMDLICIVLGADTKKDRTKDSVALIEYTFKNFQLINIQEKIVNEFSNWKICNSSSINVKKGFYKNVDIVLEDLPYNFLPVNSNHLNDVSIYIYCNPNLEAPLPTKSSIGYLTVSIDNKTVLTLNIYNSNEISKKVPINFYKDLLSEYPSYLESLFY